MMRFASRRKINFTLLLLFLLVVTVWVRDYHIRLQVSEYLTGWLLSVSIVILGLYGVRKKITTLPLLSNSVWLQAHIYTGAFSVGLFLLHIDWALPNGVLQTILFGFFVFVTCTGVMGILLSRMLPRYIRREGGEVLYERIPSYRVKIQNETEQLLIELVKDQRETSLKSYYLENLHGFFSSPGGFWTYIFRKRSYISSILNCLRREERYFNSREREFSTQIQKLIKQKYRLELQYVYQSLLKYWLFLHLPLVYGMYILIFFHIVSAYGFRGAI